MVEHDNVTLYDVTSPRASSGCRRGSRSQEPALREVYGASRWQANKYSLLYLDFAWKPSFGGHQFGTFPQTWKPYLTGFGGGNYVLP